MSSVSMKLIRTCFESEFYPIYFGGQSTHKHNVSFIDQIIAYTQDRDFIKRIVASGLPAGYEGDAIREADVIIDGALQKGFHKREDGDGKAVKPTPAAKLLKLAEEAGIELFHDAYDRAYISIAMPNKGKKNYALSQSRARMWLQKLFYEKYGIPIPAQSLKDAIDALSSQALLNSPLKSIFLRVACDENSIIVNLADDEGRVVIIDAKGYRVTTDSPVIFLNPAGTLPIPEPEAGGNLRELQQLLALSDINFCRVLGFLINCFQPTGPYLFLLVEGEHGSGKSLLCQLLKQLIDPHQAPKLRLSDSEHDLMIQAKENYLLLFDNLSGMRGDLSDALCRLSSGGGFSTRRLYTDDELQIFNECRPFILNGITSIANRADLLDRSISVKLAAMPQGQRKTEQMILREYNALRPKILGALFQVISCALRRFDEVENPTTSRMADAAKWLIAAEPATGLAEGALLYALESSQHELVEERMSNNSLAITLAKTLKNTPHDGTVGSLFDRLEQYRPRNDRDFPPTSAHFSRALERLRPALAKAGIMVEFGPKKREGKLVRAWLVEEGTFEEARALWDKEEGRKEY